MRATNLRDALRDLPDVPVDVVADGVVYEITGQRAVIVRDAYGSVKDEGSRVVLYLRRKDG